MADALRTLPFALTVLTSDENEQLRSLRLQIGLLNSLLAEHPDGRLSMTCEQLYSFTEAIESKLRDFQSALEAREDAASSGDMPSYQDVICMLGFLSGRFSLTRSQLGHITQRLHNAARVDEGLALVALSWKVGATQGMPDALEVVLASPDADEEVSAEQLATEVARCVRGVMDAQAQASTARAASAAVFAEGSSAKSGADLVGLSEATIEQMLATAAGIDSSVETALAVMDALCDGGQDQKRQRVLSAYMQALEKHGTALPELVVRLESDRAAHGREAPVLARAAFDERVASTLAVRTAVRRGGKATRAATAAAS